MSEKIDETVRFISERLKATPKVGIIIGSGLGDLASEIEVSMSLPYTEIPNFPLSTVKGHEGHLIFGITESRCQYVIKNDEILLDDYHVTKDLYGDLFDRSEEISSTMFKRFEENKGNY